MDEQYRFPVCEIFQSIEGEGIRAGAPCVFIRFVGCNLRCSYCDTIYAFNVDETTRMMTAEEIAHEVRAYDCSRVTITGGEPLLQPLELVCEQLRGIEVNIETNGSQALRSLPGNVFFTMDWKSSSSGSESAMDAANLLRLRDCDAIKFVVGTHEDMDAAAEIVPQTRAHAFFSPVFGQIEPREIVEYILSHHVDARLQIQLHKIVWDPDFRP